MNPSAMTIWEGVDRLIDRAPGLTALRMHGIHLLAADRWRSLGSSVPPDLVEDERRAVMISLAVPALLSRARAAYEGKIILLKGPEVATRYLDPARRSFIDLDLLVEDLELAQQLLIAGGCEEADDPPWALQPRERDADPFSNKHHGRPLHWPDLPLKIELHRWPNWPRWLSPPASGELFSAAVPSALEVEGILTLPPEQHTLVLAAHSWVHEPLGRVRDLLDVAVMAKDVDAFELDQLAESWGIGRLWRSTRTLADALFGEPERRTLAQRTWARNVALVRERTVFESHLERWISCFWSTPPLEALRLSASNVAWDLRPAAGEPWSVKLARTRRALRAALSPKSAHDRQLGTDARRFSPAKRWRKPPGPPD